MLKVEVLIPSVQYLEASPRLLIQVDDWENQIRLVKIDFWI